MSQHISTVTNRSSASDRFAPTRWTRVLEARGESTEARAALSELCSAYWQPVFSFIRRDGRDEETARDLTQEFFARLLARRGLEFVERGHGRFRSYLLGAVKHFLADERVRAHAAKRGGGAIPLALEQPREDATTLTLPVPDPSSPVADAFFDRQWAVTLVDRAVATLAAEETRASRGEQFIVLKPWLLGDIESRSQGDVARQLGMNEGAVKVAIHRLRKRFRETVKSEIAQTVDEPAQVSEELRYLVEVLARSAPGSAD